MSINIINFREDIQLDKSDPSEQNILTKLQNANAEQVTFKNIFTLWEFEMVYSGDKQFRPIWWDNQWQHSDSDTGPW